MASPLATPAIAVAIIMVYLLWDLSVSLRIKDSLNISKEAVFASKEFESAEIALLEDCAISKMRVSWLASLARYSTSLSLAHTSFL